MIEQIYSEDSLSLCGKANSYFSRVSLNAQRMKLEASSMELAPDYPHRLVSRT